MGSEFSTTRQQGIGLPVYDVSFWPDQSSGYSEAGPNADQPVAQQATKTAITSYGTPSNGVRIRVQDPGVPGLISPAGEAVYQGATYISRLDPAPVGDSAWHGWDPPLTVSSLQPIAFDDSGSGDFIENADITTATDGTLIAVAEARIGGVYETRVYRSTPDGYAWSSPITVETYGTSFSQRAPCLVTLTSGRIHLYESIAGFLRLWYSDDNGSTWNFGGDKISSRTIGSPTRMRAAYNRGQVLLIAQEGTNLIQFGSADMGVSLQFVTELPGTMPDVCATGEGFIVLINVGATPHLRSLRLASSYFSIADVTQDEIDPLWSVVGATDTASAYDPAGIVWIYASETDIVRPYFSYDQGRTWIAPDDATGCCRFTGATGGDLFKYSATWQRGRVVMVSQAQAPALTPDYALYSLTFGGWTTASLPSTQASYTDAASGGFDRVYLPIDVPIQLGWTQIGAGTDTIDNLGRLDITTTGGGRSYFYNTGLTASADMAVRARWNPGTSSLLMLRTSTKFLMVTGGGGALAVFDLGSGAVIGNFAYDAALADSVEIWMEIDESTGFGVVWGREILAGTQEAQTDRRRWTEIARAALTTTGTGGPSVQFGNGATTGTSKWYSVQLGDRTVGGFNISAASPHVTEAELRGRHLTGRTYALDAVDVDPSGGPSWRGEEWAIAPRPLYRAENAIERGPRVPWRSTAIDYGSSLAWQWGDAGRQLQESQTLAICVRGCNASTIQIETRDVAGWTVIGTFTPGHRGLNSDQIGRVIRPGTGYAGSLYLQPDEYAGGTLHGYSTGDTPPDYEAARIVHHTEGRWDINSPIAVAIRADRDIAAPDFVDITPADWVILVETSSDVGAVRLTFGGAAAMAAPAESYLEIGSIGFYWVYPLGNEYAWGRTVETSAQVETIRTRDGQYTHRVNSPAERRAVLNWDPFDMSQVEAEDSDPDYVLIDQGGSQQGASRGGTALVLESMVRRLDGPAAKVLYLPSLPSFTGSALLDRRREFLEGRISSAVSAAFVLGNELDDEVVQPGALEIVEEV
jgi:hypothetical protein